jgi:predicted short-subunit dehydrogenase-like oxidoreductase (DUF2520 family)
MAEAIGIAGAGRMGQALGRVLRERGASIAAVASRRAGHAAEAAVFIGGGTQPVTLPVRLKDLPQHATHIIIAVPDAAIGCVARALAAGGLRQGVVLHTSGALAADALETLSAAGVACGAIHPLQTVASPEEGVHALPGSAFAVSGDGAAAAWANQIVRLLDGVPLAIPAASRPLYHAAAVMASNYVVVLLTTAVTLMKEAGVEESLASRALAPLARTSLENALRMGPAALTGPIDRGDTHTVLLHLAALREAHPAAAGLYCAAATATLQIARQRGLPPARADALEEILKGAPDA